MYITLLPRLSQHHGNRPQQSPQAQSHCGNPMKILFGGKRNEEHNNGPHSAQQKLHVATTQNKTLVGACKSTCADARSKELLNRCIRYCVILSQGVQTAPMCKILLST